MRSCRPVLDGAVGAERLGPSPSRRTHGRRSPRPIEAIASVDRLAAAYRYTYVPGRKRFPIQELAEIRRFQLWMSGSISEAELISVRSGGLMSIRPVKRVSQSVPTMEGAGVRLRRAFGFGDTSDFDPFLMMDDFRGDRPEDYRAGFPVASPSRHRDDHLCARGQRRPRRQPRQPGNARAPATCSG